MPLIWICGSPGDHDLIQFGGECCKLHCHNILISKEDMEYYIAYMKIFMPNIESVRHVAYTNTPGDEWVSYYVWGKDNTAQSRVSILTSNDHGKYTVYHKSINDALKAASNCHIDIEIAKFLRFLIEDKPSNETK